MLFICTHSVSRSQVLQSGVHILFSQQPTVVIAYGEGMTVQRATAWARLALVVPMVVACALCALALAHTEESGPGRAELELGIDGYLEVRTRCTPARRFGSRVSNHVIWTTKLDSQESWRPVWRV